MLLTRKAFKVYVNHTVVSLVAEEDSYIFYVEHYLVPCRTKFDTRLYMHMFLLRTLKGTFSTQGVRIVWVFPLDAMGKQCEYQNVHNVKQAVDY